MDSFQRAPQTNKKCFFQISNYFSKFRQKTERYSKEYSEARILIKLQRVIYKWICVNELYKLVDFFFNFEFIFEFFGRKPKFFQKNNEA